MVFVKCCISVLLISSSAWAGIDRSIKNESSGIARNNGNNDLVSSVTLNCLLAGSEPVMTCMRRNVLSYLDHLLGVRNDFEGRQGWSDQKMDAAIARRLKKYLNAHEFKVQLPKFLFEEAVLTFNPSKGLADFKVDFPEGSKAEEVGSTEEARGHLKKKLLLPLLLLLKLKIKALTPILLVLVGIKAIKAFIMSKISLLLVAGFILLQFLKKKGMTMPMAMVPAPPTTDPTPVYGLPQAAATYGPPGPAPDTSYGPWEPSSDSNNGNNGNSAPYSRWDSHSIAYNAHQPEGTPKAAESNGI